MWSIMQISGDFFNSCLEDTIANLALRKDMGLCIAFEKYRLYISSKSLLFLCVQLCKHKNMKTYLHVQLMSFNII